MDVYEAAKQRRTIRRFQDKPVAYEALERCADAGRLAPCAKNLQELEYIIVDEKELLPRVFETVAMVAGYSSGKVRYGFEEQPKAYIITLVNIALETEYSDIAKYGHHNVGTSAASMMLVAVGEGLASCPILLFKEAQLRELLSIPEGYEIGFILALGYAAESAVVDPVTDSIAYEMDEQGVRHVPKRSLAEITHRNRFG